jgi:phage terminase large subunit GpA-like protein
MGTVAFGITVDIYKDRWAARLRRSWNGIGLQPEGHFNAPENVTDAQLKELTVEVKREKIDKVTNQRIGFEWHRPSGAANELWDNLIYTQRGDRDVVLEPEQVPGADIRQLGDLLSAVRSRPVLH